MRYEKFCYSAGQLMFWPTNGYYRASLNWGPCFGLGFYVKRYPGRKDSRSALYIYLNLFVYEFVFGYTGELK